MALESKAFFNEREVLFGLSDDQVTTLTARCNTFGSFAFSSSHTPGAGNDEAFITNVVKKLFGDSPEDELVAAVRRLYFEAYTMVAADMRARLERADDD